MKVLHVITSLRMGGAEKLMTELLPQMKECGIAVELCVFDGVKTFLYEELVRKGVVVHVLGTSVYSPLNIIRLMRIIRQYDVVHTHNTACQYYVAIASVFARCKLVTTEHSTDNRRRGNLFWKWIDKWMYSRYERVICISEETKRNLVYHLYGKDLVFSDKYLTIYNGIDLTKYVHPSVRISNGNSYVILMVGAFRWQKDQQTIVNALSLLGQNYKVCFAGAGEQKLMEKCKILAKQLNVINRVEFLGAITDIPQLLQTVDVIVQSSHVDGFCLAAVEGMASGKPVIASDIPGLGDIVGGYGILFPHEDYKALAMEIRKVCEDREYCEEVVRRCQKRARMFDISVMVKKYMDVYKYGHVVDDEENGGTACI